MFLYDSGTDSPFTSGRYAAPEEVISKAGGVNVMNDLADSWTTVGWETVVERDPDVIVICDYGDVSAEQKRRFLLSYAPLKNVSAVKHKRVVRPRLRRPRREPAQSVGDRPAGGLSALGGGPAGRLTSSSSPPPPLVPSSGALPPNPRSSNAGGAEIPSPSGV